MVRYSLVLAVAAILWPAFAFAQADAPPDGADAARLIFPGPRPPRPPGDGWAWVPPTYRTVYDRVWQPPVYDTIIEQVWVPDQYAWRTVECWENGILVYRPVWTLIRPGHFTTRTRRVVISPGGWAYRPRREMVTPGHWAWRGPMPPPVPWPQPIPPPVPWPQPIPPPVPPTTPAPRPPGLEPFSPLWEWPVGAREG